MKKLKKAMAISALVISMAFVVMLLWVLVQPVLATVRRQTNDMIGAFTGPRAGYNTDDNIKAALDQLHDKITMGAARRAYGTVYYCDNNHGDDTYDGLSWETAVQTLAQAMSLSHAKIASGGHATDRNTIYYMADAETATLTTLAQKTDIVGVGSMDACHRPKIIGDHTIPDTVNYAGCRFYNVEFRGTGAAAEIVHLNTQAGIEFHNCEFQAAGNNDYSLRVEECQALVVEDCEFYGALTAGLYVADDTDSIYRYKIHNNRFIAIAGIGIDWDEADSVACFITDNYIQSVGDTIDDEGDSTFCINNRLITDVDVDTYAEGTGWDFDPQKAAGNIIMGSGGTDSVANTIPIIEESDAS